MELRIDLSDRADIDAAHQLLGTILGATAVPPVATATTAPDMNGTQDGTLGNVPEELLAGAPSGADAAALPSVPEGLLAGEQSDTSASTSPVAPTAPQPPVAPSTHAPAAGPATVDKEGIPWDKRIHSSPPSINKGDGMWRSKKGLNDAALVASVTAELKALMAIPQGAAPQAPAAPVAPPPAPVAPPAPAAAPVAPTSATVPTTPQELIPRVTAANAAGTLPPTALLEACAAYGIPNIPGLFQRPDKVAEVYAYLQACHPAFA